MPSIFPTRPAFSSNNFFDHFASLDTTRWSSVTSGTGSISVTDSYAEILSPVSSAAFLYRSVKVDKTKSQLWTVCLSMERLSGTGGLNYPVALLNGASAPTADTDANIAAKTLFGTGFGGGSLPTQFHPTYYDSGSVLTFYNTATDAWTSAYPGNANLANPEARYDDYYIFGIEIDGVNSRWRVLYWGQSFATAGTWEFNQGWRLFACSAWVNWSTLRSSSDVWLVLGQPANDAAGSWRTRVEWVRYAEALAGNKVLDAWVASKQDLASAHRVKHVYSYDGLTFVPQDITTWALDLNTVSPDNTEINELCAVYDGVSTDNLFYTGTTGTTKSICRASATHVAAGTGQTATFTRSASNPMLSLGASGAFDDQAIGSAYVVKDDTDTDTTKRWKMLYAGQKASDSKHRIGYATASNADGPWTKQGMVIDVGGSGANDEAAAWGVAIAKIGDTWDVWYDGWDAAGAIHLMRATGTSLGSLTKDTTYYSSPTGADEALTASMTTAPGRTVTVADTTGFMADAPVIISQSTTQDNYVTSRIRKVTSSTQLELYHGITGVTTAYPAHIKQLDNTTRMSIRSVVRVGSEWWFLLCGFEAFSSGSYFALCEENFLFTHTGATPAASTPTIQYLASPITSRGFSNNQRSVENIALLLGPVPNEVFPTSRRSMHHYRRDVFRSRVV